MNAIVFSVILLPVLFSLRFSRPLTDNSGNAIGVVLCFVLLLVSPFTGRFVFLGDAAAGLIAFWVWRRTGRLLESNRGDLVSVKPSTLTVARQI